jgi:hypothetical protein
VGKSKCAVGSNSWVGGDGQHSVSGVDNALAPHENHFPQTLEAPEPLLDAQLLGSFPSMEQSEPGNAAELSAAAATGLMELPEWQTIVNFPGWVPAMEPPMAAQSAAETSYEPQPQQLRTLTHEESEVLLGQPNSSVVPQSNVEELPSAALECVLDFEHSQAVEAGRSENPFTSPTREDMERSLYGLPRGCAELGHGADKGAVGAGNFARFDLDILFDGWEGFDELCPDKA